MYIENKSKELSGNSRIGYITYSNSKRSMSYQGKTFLKCIGYKFNCIDVEDGSHWWITGPKKRGGDRLYSGGVIHVDDDALDEYWNVVRKDPDNVGCRIIKF